MKVRLNFLVSLMMIFGCASQRAKEVNAKLSEAQKSFNQKRYLEARNLCEDILVNDPYNKSAVELLRKAYKALYVRDKTRKGYDIDASEWEHIPNIDFIDQNNMTYKWGK